jgi:chromosome segregation protein
MAASSLAGVAAAEYAKAQAVTAAAQRALDEAIVAHATASSAAAASAARVEALQASIDAQVLSIKTLHDATGSVGTLLDLIDIDDDWRSAVQAALGESIAAVVIDDTTNARAALAHLRATKNPGAVLALDSLQSATANPSRELRAHVRARGGAHEAGINHLLDVLLSRVSLADSFDGAVDAALRDPNAVVVTRDGDRLAATSLRVGLGLVSNVALASAQQSAQDAAARLVAVELALHTARTGLAEARDSEARAATTAEVERAAVQDHDIEVAGLEQRENLLRARMAEIEGRLGGDSDARRDAARQTQRIDQEMLKLATAFTAVENIVNVLNAHAHATSCGPATAPRCARSAVGWMPHAKSARPTKRPSKNAANSTVGWKLNKAKCVCDLKPPSTRCAASSKSSHKWPSTPWHPNCPMA